ncbi:uncharacterized protein DS421_18g616310 [Arachis hypogaea]|nr:uncharacterized protein DS421_18g616310 [Arachis hypogaea]
MLICNHPVSPDRYNDRVEEHLRVTGFYHASQIGVVQCQKALINALIERWHPDIHMFHLPISECAVTLEDVALILGLPTDDLPVTGMAMSSFEALEAEYLDQFGVAPRKQECRGCCIKLTWLRDLKENFQLTDEISIQRASRFNCKEIDGPLTLLLGWAWIRLPYLSPLPREPRNFSLANRWRNWECDDRRYRYLMLSHFRKAFDELQDGQFVWTAYAVDRVDPNIIPAEIYVQSVVWSATVPLVSFECIEWHAIDRIRRQFGFIQGVPHQEWNLDKAHGEVLTGPKNLNWATAPSHSFWVMHWTNSFVVQENDEDNQDMDQGNEDMDQGNDDMDEGSQDVDDDNEEQEPQSTPPSGPNLLPQEQPQFSSQYVPQTQFTPVISNASTLLGYSLDARLPCHTSSVASGGFVSVDSSRSEGGRGVLNSQNPNRVSIGPLEEDANTLEEEANAYLVDDPDDEDDDEEDEIEEFDEDEESRNDGQAHTSDDKGKGYNLRIDPPRRSTNRYIPSVFKKATKKCKNFVKDVKWAMRK